MWINFWIFSSIFAVLQVFLEFSGLIRYFGSFSGPKYPNRLGSEIYPKITGIEIIDLNRPGPDKTRLETTRTRQNPTRKIIDTYMGLNFYDPKDPDPRRSNLNLIRGPGCPGFLCNEPLNYQINLLNLI